jgi:hypothetical protein
MKKIVINVCFGGFGLSDKAMRRYAEIKGLTLYPEKRQFGFTTYWTVPEDQRPKKIEHWYEASSEERIAYNNAHRESSIYDGDLKRDDPALVQVVEELGDKANGSCAALRVVEIPDDVDWEIDEYDGNEKIAEKHRTWR